MLWCTGLSGAGKSTIANRVETELHRRGQYIYLLDGDNVRHGLNRDLGFTDAYKKARDGEIRNFTGIDSAYEPPEHPEIRLQTTRMSPDAAAAIVIGFLEQRGLVPPG